MPDRPLVYQSMNTAVLDAVPAGGHVLDVGCGGGAMGAWLRARRNCRVVGVTHSLAEAALAREVLDGVVLADLDAYAPQVEPTYDCVLCSHVLEHLVHPVRLLQVLRPGLRAGGVLVVALPNPLFWRQRLEFMRGRFRYTEGGLMDRTHLRFFDWEGAAELVSSAGFRVLSRRATGSLPGSRHLGRRLAGAIDRWALERFPSLFGFQFVLVAQVPAADGTRE